MITQEDNSKEIKDSGLVMADLKVMLQVIDRLFAVGGVKGKESLPIAVVREKISRIIGEE